MNELEAESTERVARIVLGSELESPLEAMKAGVEAFLDGCAEPELQQIALHDAPAVLGWDRWREIGAANGLGLIEASLPAAIEAGEIRALPVSRWPTCCSARSTRRRCWSPAPRPGGGRAEVAADLRPLLGLSAPPYCASAHQASPYRQCASRCAIAGLVGDAPRLLLRVHAHVGELHRGGGRRPPRGSPPCPRRR